MADSERSIEGIANTEPGNNESNNNKNNESSNKEGEFWVELNGSQDNPNNNNTTSKLLQTVKSLQAELLSVKENNEKIMKAQEELHQVLLDKIHKEEEEKNDKSNGHKTERVTTSYKKRGRKLHFSDNNNSTSSESSIKTVRNKKEYTSDSSESSP